MYKIYNAFICGKEFCSSKKSLLIMKLAMVLLTLATLQVSAQQTKTITGKVVDEKSMPLPGVYVKDKDRPSVATTTNAQGEYRLVLPDANATIVISFIGYDTQEQSARGKSIINVSMVPTNTGLTEVVVVGYGTQQRASLTDAIGTINAAEIKRNSVTDLTNAIVGRTPGVRVTTEDSNPGLYHTDIDIRGFSGAAGGQQGPLYVIDGIPRDKSSFDHLDPNEIESFSVLKDASAAIYGVEAANGVILVTTRKGEAGKVQVNYSGQYGEVIILKYPDLENGYEQESTYDEAQFNTASSNRSNPITPKYTYQNIQDYYNGKSESTDWIRAIINTRSTQWQHNLNLSGGSDVVKFFSSGGLIHEGGLLSSGIEYSDKYNARQTVTATLAKGLVAEFNFSFIDEIYNRPNQSTGRYYNLTRNDWSFTPQDQVFLFDNPKYYGQALDQGLDNPRALIDPNAAGYDHFDDKRLYSVTSLSWAVPFVKGLTAKFQIGYDFYNSVDKQLLHDWNQYQWDYTNNKYITFAHSYPANLTQNVTETTRNDVQTSLSYQKHFGKNNISALALWETLYQEDDNTQASSNFAVDAIDLLNTGLAVGQVAKGGKNFSVGNWYPSDNESLIGRLNYDYAGKYLLEGGFRYEGSSLFPANSRWGFFPYVSGGWRISEEPFIKNNLKWVDNIKLRGSYGRLGDDQGAAFPSFITGFTYPSSNSLYAAAAGRNGGDQVGTVFGPSGGITKGVDYKSIANPNITWYTSITSDIGLETSFWHSLLTAEFDVFNRSRTGLLATAIVAVPGNFGGTLPQVNLNSDRTRGFEITLGHRDVAGELNYGISANMSFSRSNWGHHEETPAANPYANWTGTTTNRYVDFIRGRLVSGQYQSYAEIYADPVIIDGNGNRTLLPGDLKYVDVNGDGKSDGNDNVVLANGGLKPLVFFGTTFDANWRGFDLTFLIQGATDYNVRYGDGLSDPFIRDPQTPITAFVDRWHRADLFDNNSAWVPGRWPSTPAAGVGGERQDGLDQSSQYTVFNGTYARIKQIQIGYTFPKKLLSKVNISKLRIFVAAYDFFTWHAKGLDFVDPEYTDNNPQTGSNYNAPMSGNITAGANLTF